MTCVSLTLHIFQGLNVGDITEVRPAKSVFTEIIPYLHAGKSLGENYSKKSREFLNTGLYGGATIFLLVFHLAGLFGTRLIKAVAIRIVKLQLQIFTIVSGYFVLCGMECYRGKVSQRAISCRGTKR